MQLSDALGYLAATLTTASFVPQAWRTFRTKDVSGISLKMYVVFTVGVAVWLAYGIVLGEVPMMLSNSSTLVLACAVLAMKVKYRKKKPDDPQDRQRHKPEDPQDPQRRDKSRMARA